MRSGSCDFKLAPWWVGVCNIVVNWPAAAFWAHHGRSHPSDACQTDRSWRTLLGAMVGVIAHNLLFRQVVSLSKVAAFFAYVGLVLATAPLVARYLKAS